MSVKCFAPKVSRVLVPQTELSQVFGGGFLDHGGCVPGRSVTLFCEHADVRDGDSSLEGYDCDKATRRLK